jgi:hypothetical protein
VPAKWRFTASSHIYFDSVMAISRGNRLPDGRDPSVNQKVRKNTLLCHQTEGSAITVCVYIHDISRPGGNEQNGS